MRLNVARLIVTTAAAALLSACAADTTTAPAVTPRMALGAGKAYGCTPGFWKQEQKFGFWVDFTRTDMVDAVFGLDGTTYPVFRSTQNNNPTGALNLLQALELNGNSGGEALFRIGTAALLSASKGTLNYPISASVVQSAVRDTWTAYVATGDINALNAVKDQLDKWNNANCPL